jgi:hypothetical protein
MKQYMKHKKGARQKAKGAHFSYAPFAFSL